jgi:predicted PurR-regulated permease PerM
LLTYFIKQHIKSITLQGNKLIIEFNNSQTETKDTSDQELQPIYSYLQAQGLTSLSLSDLQATNSNTEKPTNYLPYILGGVGVLVLIGIIVYFLTKKRKRIKI